MVIARQLRVGPRLQVRLRHRRGRADDLGPNPEAERALVCGHRSNWWARPRGSAMTAVRFASVSKSYANGFVAVHDLDLEVADGELLVVVGPSGCGKTT